MLDIYSMNYVLITGISTGIGHYLAKLLSAEAYGVIGTYRDIKSIDPEFLKNDNIQLIQMDLSVEESIANGFETVKQIVSGQGLYAIINNAGYAQAGPVTHLPIQLIRKQFDVNLFGTIQVIQHGFSLLKQYGKGARIINISSVSGIVASPFLGAYAASKFALEGISDSLRRELKLMDIKLIIIQPGPLKTPIWRKNLDVAALFNDSPYAPYMTRTREVILNTEQNALALDCLKPIMLKSLKLTNPKSRYLVHKNKILFSLLTKYLPVPLLDYLIHRNLTLKKQNIRPF